MNNIAFGCSHTWAVGVDKHEAWPALLNCKNYGARGVSADYICRIMPDIIDQNRPEKIYILWPDWTRFEYVKNGIYKQSLPSDADRIFFMEQWTEEKLKNNFDNSVTATVNLCQEKKIKLIHMTLYDLIPHIGHADKWPLSKLGHHYSPVWHTWVANIFRQLEQQYE